MLLGLPQAAGIIITLILILLLMIFTSGKTKNARDFTIGGGKASSIMVSGAIIGTLVGGASTVATAQLAFTYGFSAIWFCLGAGIGCLVLGLFFARPMRRSGYLTLQEMIHHEYGAKAGFLASVLSTLGIFFNIIAQLLSGMALLSSFFELSQTLCAVIVAVLMISFVIFGGIQGLGRIGTVKTVILYVCTILSIIIVLLNMGGFGALYDQLPHEQYFSIFARGFGTDAGAGFSLIIGVLSTQTYAQSILSAKSDKAAVQGALASACLIPPIGVGGVLIGMFMKINHPAIDAAQAFPQFLLNYMPGFAAGIFLAGLLITIIGCGAGLSLGISSVIINNLHGKAVLSDKRKLIESRIIIAAVLVLAIFFTVGNLKSIILQWSFMSMALRGTVLFLPLIGALFLPKKIHPAAASASIIAGPLFVLVGNMFMELSFDPLFLGIAANAVIMIIGYICGKRRA